MANISSIGILTSGGDAPGMNAAIRAITRVARYNQIKVYGIYHGYKGLITDEIKEFTSSSVSNIIQKGGTILRTARCMEFKEKEGRNIAYANLVKHQIDALVVIGGDGTITGARTFANEYDVPIIALPGTIDNDLSGTDQTIGYSTALCTIVDAVDKLRDTATSHQRLFFVEVMGRRAGYLAISSAIASGAEDAIINEVASDESQVKTLIDNGFRKSKSSAIVIVAENPDDPNGGAMGIAKYIEENYPEYDARVTILGHLQRGGSPTVEDRILASRMGAAAVQALLDGQRNIMIGCINDEMTYVPFSRALSRSKTVKKELIDLIKILSM